MKKKEVQKKYLEKIKLINNYNKNYYELSKPLVDDQHYDNLKKEIILLEKKFTFFRSKFLQLQL